MTEESDYNDKVGRSFIPEDLKNILEVANAVAPLARLPLGDAAITVLDSTGSYGLGEVWWDSESEAWKWDPKMYGEA